MRRGRPVSSIRSDSSDAHVEGLAERKLERLQRQFRSMERDHQAYSSEIQDLIRRQFAEIKKLEKEYDELTQLSENRVNQLHDQDKKENLSSLLDQEGRLEEKLAREKQTKEDLDQEIRHLEKEIAEQRKKSAGPARPRKQNQLLQKKILKLENRLDREMHDIRRKTDSVIETSSAACDARDETQMKMQQLKEKAEKNLGHHAIEIKEQERLIDHERKLKEFMGIKGQENSPEEDTSEKGKRDSKEEAVKSYELAFQKIQKVMEEDNLDVLVQKCIEVEDRNFALSNYVNEQNIEIEILQESISKIQAEIDTLVCQTLHLENEQKKILKENELRINDAVRQVNKYEKDQKRCLKIADQLKAGAESLFKKLNCDQSVPDEMLGTSDGIQNDNIMQDMGLSEQRISEMLGIQSYLNSKDYEKPSNPQEAARGMPCQLEEMPSHNFSIQTPSIGEDSDNEGEGDLTVSDEEEQTLTQSELRENAMERVLKKEEEASKKDLHSYNTVVKREKVHKNNLLSSPRKHHQEVLSPR